MKYKKFSNMSIVQLQNYLKNYEEKKGRVPYELKSEIEFQIERQEINNKIWCDQVVKSKWFKLGIARTIEKGQATRVLIGENVIYHLEADDVVLNLFDLTITALNKRNFNFIEELNKL